MKSCFFNSNFLKRVEEIELIKKKQLNNKIKSKNKETTQTVKYHLTFEKNKCRCYRSKSKSGLKEYV